MHNNKSVRRVKEFLTQQQVDYKMVFLPDSARTAREAADAIRCTIEQIAKSIVFIGKGTKTTYLIIASGINRIDEKKVAKEINEPLKMATADEVRELTGFVIGGVAPVGHTKQVTILIDKDLFAHEKIWAAAGHPKAVFELTPENLETLTKGDVIEVS